MLRRFFDAQSSKETQLDHLHSSRITLRQTVERIVERTEHEGSVGLGGRNLLRIDPPAIVPLAARRHPLRGGPGKRRVDEDTPHDLSRQREEMCAIVPVHMVCLRESEEQLMDERVLCNVRSARSRRIYRRACARSCA